jgi:hypothetical protein
VEYYGFTIYGLRRLKIRKMRGRPAAMAFAS